MNEYIVGFYVCLLVRADSTDASIEDASADLKALLDSEGFTHRVAGIQPLHSMLVPEDEVGY